MLSLSTGPVDGRNNTTSAMMDPPELTALQPFSTSMTGRPPRGMSPADLSQSDHNSLGESQRSNGISGFTSSGWRADVAAAGRSTAGEDKYRQDARRLSFATGGGLEGSLRAHMQEDTTEDHRRGGGDGIAGDSTRGLRAHLAMSTTSSDAGARRRRRGGTAASLKHKLYSFIMMILFPIRWLLTKLVSDCFDPSDDFETTVRKGVMSIGFVLNVPYFINQFFLFYIDINAYYNPSLYLALVFLLGDCLHILTMSGCYIFMRCTRRTPTWLFIVLCLQLQQSTFITVIMNWYRIAPPTLLLNLVITVMTCPKKIVALCFMISLLSMGLNMGQLAVGFFNPYEVPLAMKATKAPLTTAMTTTTTSSPTSSSSSKSCNFRQVIPNTPLLTFTSPHICHMTISEYSVTEMFPFFIIFAAITALFYLFEEALHKAMLAEQMTREVSDKIRKYDTDGMRAVLKQYYVGPANQKSGAGMHRDDEEEEEDDREDEDNDSDENSKMKGIQVDQSLVRTFSAICDNLEKFRPHLPNYVLPKQEETTTSGEDDKTSNDGEDEDEDDEGDLSTQGSGRNKSSSQNYPGSSSSLTAGIKSVGSTSQLDARKSSSAKGKSGGGKRSSTALGGESSSAEFSSNASSPSTAFGGKKETGANGRLAKVVARMQGGAHGAPNSSPLLATQLGVPFRSNATVCIVQVTWTVGSASTAASGTGGNSATGGMSAKETPMIALEGNNSSPSSPATGSNDIPLVNFISANQRTGTIASINSTGSGGKSAAANAAAAAVVITETINGFIVLCNEISKATKASMHSFLGDKLVLTWNATNRVGKPESKACFFALRLHEAIRRTSGAAAGGGGVQIRTMSPGNSMTGVPPPAASLMFAERLDTSMMVPGPGMGTTAASGGGGGHFLDKPSNNVAGMFSTSMNGRPMLHHPNNSLHGGGSMIMSNPAMAKLGEHVSVASMITSGPALSCFAGDRVTRTFTCSAPEVWHRAFKGLDKSRHFRLPVVDDVVRSAAGLDVISRGLMLLRMKVDAPPTTNPSSGGGVPNGMKSGSANNVLTMSPSTASSPSFAPPPPVIKSCCLYELLEERGAVAKDQEWMYTVAEQEKGKDANDIVSRALTLFSQEKLSEALAALKSIPLDHEIRKTRGVQELCMAIEAEQRRLEGDLLP